MLIVDLFEAILDIPCHWGCDYSGDDDRVCRSDYWSPKRFVLNKNGPTNCLNSGRVGLI